MAFTFKLEHPDGTPADAPTLQSATPIRILETSSTSAPGQIPSGHQGPPQRQTDVTTLWSTPATATSM